MFAKYFLAISTALHRAATTLRITAHQAVVSTKVLAVDKAEEKHEDLRDALTELARAAHEAGCEVTAARIELSNSLESEYAVIDKLDASLK